MKINLTKIIIAALVLIASFLFFDDSCSKKKLHKALGAYEYQVELTQKAEARADEEIEKHEASKKSSQEKIENLMAELSEANKIDREKDESLKKLEEERPELKTEDEVIKNLDEQILIWSDKFSLAQERIQKLGEPFEVQTETGEKVIRYPEGSITFELNKKYLDQAVITEQWKLKYNSEVDARASADKALKECQKASKRIEFGSKLKSAIIRGAIAGAVTGLVAKDAKLGAAVGAGVFTISIAF